MGLHTSGGREALRMGLHTSGGRALGMGARDSSGAELGSVGDEGGNPSVSLGASIDSVVPTLYLVLVRCFAGTVSVNAIASLQGALVRWPPAPRSVVDGP